MGVVKKQGMLTALIIYLGVFIGYINVGILMTRYFSPSEIGVRSMLLDFSFIFMQFIFLGTQSSMIKFSGDYHQEGKIKGYLSYFMLVSGAAYVFFCVLLKLNEDFFLGLYSTNSPLFSEFFDLVYVITFSFVLNVLVENCFRILHNTFVPALFKEFFQRILVTLLIILYIFGVIDFKGFIWLFGCSFFSIFVGLLLILIFKQKVDFNIDSRLVHKKFVQTIARYSVTVFFSASTSIILLRVDSVMIGALMGDTQLDGAHFVGIYAIGVFFVSLIDIPRRAIISIVNPLISSLITKDDFAEVSKVYKKTSATASSLGLLLFGALVISFQDVLDIIPNGQSYEQAFWVVVIVGCSKLVQMYFSASSEVMVFSKYYTFQLYFSVVALAIGVMLNYVFVSNWGLIGAAFATLATYFLFALMKYFFIRSKFNFTLFNGYTGLHLVVTLVWIGFIWYYLEVNNPYLSILLKCFLFVVFYLPFTYFIKISSDLNGVVDALILKTREILK